MFAVAALAVVPVPPLGGRVNDLAGLLSATERQALERDFESFETETSHQVVVLTVPTLDGEDIAAFTLRVVEAWKIGHKGLDNGAVVAVAAQDRKARIEVGYGLEGVVPDAIAARILREQMIPSFRAGRMGEGIVRGARAVMAAARGEVIPAERRPSRRRAPASGDPMGVIFFCAIFGGTIGSALSKRSRFVGAVVGAIFAFCMAFAMLKLLPLAALSSALAGFFGTLGGGTSGGGGHRRVIHGFPAGGWGSRGGFGGGGGGFGGGGFGGGGGGFGGGGASGSW